MNISPRMQKPPTQNHKREEYFIGCFEAGMDGCWSCPLVPAFIHEIDRENE